MLKIVLSSFLMIALANSANAQKAFAKDADAAFRNEAYSKAVVLYKKAYPNATKAPDKARIIFQIGESYKFMNDNVNAESSYSEAIELGYTSQDVDVLLYLGEVQKKQGKYDDAIGSYKAYSVAGGDPAVSRAKVKSTVLAKEKGISASKIEYTLQVMVFDKDSKKPLANTRIKVVGTDNSSYEIVTDPNGGFNFELNGDERYIKQGTTYSIHVDKADYLVAKDQISTIGMKESKSFIKEFYIQRASSEVPIKLENVVYQGSALVAGNGKTGLDDLIQILRDNPTMNIEIQVHTDQRGNAKDNLELSQQRAEIARIDLVTKGIAKDRVKAKGYGGAQPLNGFSKADIDELPTKEAQEKAHKRNRRTEFTVLNFDHQPN